MQQVGEACDTAKPLALWGSGRVPDIATGQLLLLTILQMRKLRPREVKHAARDRKGGVGI